MIRLSTLFFCLLLAAAAVGRYRAEANVRADRAEIGQIEKQIRIEEDRIGELRLDVEVLESGPRLAQLSERRLDLRPMHSTQLADAGSFASLVALDEAPRERTAPHRNGDFIIDAIAMAGFGQPTLGASGPGAEGR